jgi:tetratricopeptide (TPR) repeat protein
VIQVYLQVATNHMLRGRARACLEWSEKALEPAHRFGRLEDEQRALQLRGIARGDLGDYRDGIDDIRKAVDICVALGLGQDGYRAKGNLADFLWVVEGPETGLSVMRDGIEWADSHGVKAGAYWGKSESLWMLFDLGRWDEMLVLEEEIVDWGRRLGARYTETLSSSYGAQVLVWRGHVVGAAARADRFLPLAREIRDPQVLLPALAIAAVVRRAEGDLPGAMELIREEADLVMNAESAFFNFFHLTDVARICAAADALDVVEAILERVQPTAAREHHGVLTARAVTSEARGSLEEAARLYVQAADDWARFPHPLEQGLALMGAGRCLLGHTGTGKEELVAARRILSSLGAAPSLAEADELLQRAVAQTS